MAAVSRAISREVSFEDAAWLLLESALKKVEDNAAGTRDGVARSEATPKQVKALHDMRVGTRRLRAALSVFDSVLPPARRRRLEKELARLTDALGVVRDLDVQLEMLRGLAGTMPAGEAYGIERLIEAQTLRRDRERKRLLETLDDLRKSGFADDFRRALAKALPDHPVRADTASV